MDVNFLKEIIELIPERTPEEKELKYQKDKEMILSCYPTENYFHSMLFWMEGNDLKSNIYKFLKEDYDIVMKSFDKIPLKEQVEELVNKYALK